MATDAQRLAFQRKQQELFRLQKAASDYALTLQDDPFVNTPIVGCEDTPDIDPPTPGLAQMTFAEIAAGAEPWMKLVSPLSYVAEFLRQNPGVCFWEVDGQSVKELEDPDGGTVVTAPEPSLLTDDTAAVQQFIDATPAGSTVVFPGGRYRINNLQLRKNLRLSSLDAIPATTSQEQFIKVTAPAVEIFDSHLDGQNLSVVFGVNVETASHDFKLVRSTVENFRYKGDLGWSMAAAVSLRVNSRSHIAGCTIRSILGTDAKAGVRAVWMSGRPNDTINYIGGTFVNNLVEELEGTNTASGLRDADVVVAQFIRNNAFSGDPYFVAANRCVNAGGRLVKSQNGGHIHCFSNTYHWKDRFGLLGERKLKAFFDTQNSSDNVVMNNHVINDAGYSISGLMSILSNVNIPDSIVYDYNRLTINHSGTNSANDFVFFGSGSGAATGPTGREATNSSFNHNLIDGSGRVDGICAYYDGWLPGVMNADDNDVTLSHASYNIDPR